MEDEPIFQRYFCSIVKDDVLKDIMRHIFKGYKDADEFVKQREYQPGPAKNAYPYTRWFEIDNNILAMNKKYPGLEVISQPNVICNSFHTLVTIDKVRLTISAVDAPTSLPRSAKFRNDIARWQSCFVIDGGRLQIVDQDGNSSLIYAFVTHGPVADNQSFPEFIRIAFPNEHCTKYVDFIDLFKKYPDFVQELKQQDMVHIKDNAEVTLNVVEKPKLL